MCSHHQQSRKLLRSDPHLPQDRVSFLCKRAERCRHSFSFSALRLEIKASGSRDGDGSLSGATVACWALQPLPVSNPGNAEDVESCETSSYMSQLTDLQGCSRKKPPSPPLLFIEESDGPQKKCWQRVWWSCVHHLSNENHAGVKWTSLTPDLPVGRGQLRLTFTQV